MFISIMFLPYSGLVMYNNIHYYLANERCWLSVSRRLLQFFLVSFDFAHVIFPPPSCTQSILSYQSTPQSNNNKSFLSYYSLIQQIQLQIIIYTNMIARTFVILAAAIGSTTAFTVQPLGRTSMQLMVSYLVAGIGGSCQLQL